MIKFREQKIISVKDWDNLVKETYGRPYAFQQQDDCRQRGMFHLNIPCDIEDFDDDNIPVCANAREKGVSFATWLSREVNKKDNELSNRLFWYRNFYPHISMIASDLYEKGLIPAGNYSINIDW